MTTMSLFDLTSKVAFITGSGGGLGYECAIALAEAGADVVCTARRGETAEATAKEVEKLGRKALALTCDVAEEPDIINAVQEAVNHFHKIDILVNNAGIMDPGPWGPLHELDSETWHKTLDVDLHGAFYAAREALKFMVAQGSGKVINMVSMWGLAGTSSVFPAPIYSTAKGALINLTRELGLEYAKQNIQVNALCPGFHKTEIAGGAYHVPDYVAAFEEWTPMGRVAEAAEIRGPVVFLASAASNFMTGSMLVVDGGCLAK